MKKFAVLLIAALVAVGSLSAATLDIGGTVSANTTVAVNAPLGKIDLTLVNDASAGATGNTTMTVTSNKKTWTVTLTSANSGTLLGTKGGTIDYTVKLTQTGTLPNGGEVTNALSSAVKLATPKTVAGATDSRTSKAGCAFTLDVAVTQQGDTVALWEADTYTDQITISIIAA